MANSHDEYACKYKSVDCWKQARALRFSQVGEWKTRVHLDKAGFFQNSVDIAYVLMF